MPVRGKMNLAIVDLETRKGTAITNFADFDVLGFHWVGNDRLVFNLGQINTPTGPEQFDGGGLFLVSRDGKESKKLSPTVREQRDSNVVTSAGSTSCRPSPATDEILVMATCAPGFTGRLPARPAQRRTSLVSGDRPLFAHDWILDNKRACLGSSVPGSRTP